MKKLLVVAVAAALSGCAGFTQALVGYESAAYAGMKAHNDNLIQVWKAAACGTPVSAALRNPDIIPALQALCFEGAKVDAGSLLSPAARAGRE